MAKPKRGTKKDMRLKRNKKARGRKQRNNPKSKKR